MSRKKQEMEKSGKSRWFREFLTRDEIHGHHIKKIVARLRTPYQLAEIIDTFDYGRCLFLDGLVQSTELDEFIYHESLVHPALLMHPRPERIFVGGGSEGAPLREALKHPSIRQTVMVDIDQDVIRLARKHLRKWHCGAFKDPKVRVFIADARKFLEKDPAKYDCIFLDLCDPGESGPSQSLFAAEFYALVKSRLENEGLVVVQGGSANLNMAKGFPNVYQSLKHVFPHVLAYQSCVHSYVGPWAFFLAGRKELKADLSLEVLAQRFKRRKLAAKLRFYDPRIHLAMFTLPAYFQELLKTGKAISDKKPLSIRRKGRQK
jgi:spermidine synthase